MRLKEGVLLVVLCLGTAMAVAVSGRNDTTSSEVISAAVKATFHANPSATLSEPSQADLNFDLSAIKRTVPKQKQSGGLFQSKSWYTPPPQPPPPVRSLPPPQPVAPSLSFKFIGRMIDGNDVVLFLTKNGRQYTVKVNDILDDTYRVDKIADNLAVLTYLPMNMQQTLTFNSTAVNTPAVITPLVNALAVTAQIFPVIPYAPELQQEQQNISPP